MTAPLSPSNRSAPASSTVSGRRLAAHNPVLHNAPVSTPLPQELLCAWVPGTTNIVRLRISAERTIEVTSASLSRIFGKEAVHELYLKGRARVSASPQQIALLT